MINKSIIIMYIIFFIIHRYNCSSKLHLRFHVSSSTYEKMIITSKFSKRCLNHKVVKPGLSFWHHRYDSEDGTI